LDTFELRRVHVSDVTFGEKSSFSRGILTINADDVRSVVLQDRFIKSVDVQIARPGEEKRIVPIKDILEPRAKANGDPVFPGCGTEPDYIAGTGSTVVLDGVCVVTTGTMVNFQEGLVDMTGPGAEYSLFSGKINVALVIAPVDGLGKHEHERAVRLAGINVARYLGSLAVEAEYEPEIYPATSPFDFPELPKVVYVCQIIAQGLLHDNYIYGLNAQGCLPVLFRPTEFMDGAVVSGNCAAPCHKHTTYHHQNNPIVEDLYSEHGKTLNFAGVIVAPVRTAFADKERICRQIAKMAEMLGTDGVILSEDGGGNPEVDLMLTTRLLERSGIKTVIVTDEYAGSDGASAGLADVTPEADAVVTNGNGNQRVTLPPLSVIGDIRTVERITGGHAGGLHDDGSIDMEIAGIMGSTNELGAESLTTVLI
jgi:glycine reductase